MEKSSEPQPLLLVENLKKYFSVGGGLFFRNKGQVRAVDGVSFSLRRGETLGLVGESGCGKSTIGFSLLRLIEPNGGKIFFEGKDILRLKKEELRSLRNVIQIIFQDPYSSLDPRMTVGRIVGEGLRIHQIGSQREREDRVAQMLREVGLRPEHKNRYPHEFSGGQRQRIGIARALILRPKLIVADEPVSALDVSIQAQVLNLLGEIQEKYRLSYLIISHDLGVVAHMCDWVAVMYLGRIVELAEASRIYSAPLHPYTEALLSAIPIPDPSKRKKRILLQGDVASPIHPPRGCHFHPRCGRKMALCADVAPELQLAGPDHRVACHLHISAREGQAAGSLL